MQMHNSHDIYSIVVLNMNAHKKNALQTQIVSQAGTDRLLLNDIILGLEGSQIIAHLIPQYHSRMQHLEIKGNNIDAEGFQTICIALLHCTSLKSIMAQWNSVGSSPAGFRGLLKLAKKAKQLQYIDLKNNRIPHQTANEIVELIRMNHQSLKVIDLRWNDLGEIGGKAILSALPFNSALKFIGLEDNRISTKTLNEIQGWLQDEMRGQRNIHEQKPLAEKQVNYFPFSDGAYGSMDDQVRCGNLRQKIQKQSQEADIHIQKIHIQIEHTLQKIKAIGAQRNQLDAKMSNLLKDNENLLAKLQEAEALLSYEKEKTLGIDQRLNNDKSILRNEKYHKGTNHHENIEMVELNNARELDEIDEIMNKKHDQLRSLLKSGLAEKRRNREKLIDLRQHRTSLQIQKEQTASSFSNHLIANQKDSNEEKINLVEQQIADMESALYSQKKKASYLREQLTEEVLKGLKREEKYEKDSFQLQNKIKQLHNSMTMTNLDIEMNGCKKELGNSKVHDLEQEVQMLKKHARCVDQQGGIQAEIERLKECEDMKTAQVSELYLDERVRMLENAIRAQNSANKMVSNQYQKLLNMVENSARNSARSVIYQQN